MNMTTVEAFTKLNQNNELAEKVKNECKTPEQVYEVLKKNQYGQYLKDVLDGKFLDMTQ